MKPHRKRERPEDGIEIGERLRTVRLRRRMTLLSVAESAGLSESFVSQLERGRVNASIASLQRIAAALNISVAELFERADGSESRLIRKADRPSLRYGVLGQKFLLTPTPLENLEVFVGTFNPEGSTGDELYAHGDSDELFVVLKGRFELSVGDDVFVMSEGDSVSYRSSRPHRAANASPEEGEVMWIISPPSM